MNIQLKEITPNKKNPRFIRDEQFEKLKRSVAQFPAMLEKRGLAVRKQGKKWEAIGGNMRLRALTELQGEMSNPERFMESYGIGKKEIQILQTYFSAGIPCVDCSDFTPAEAQRFVIADNVPFGEWDTDVLANEWDADELGEWGLEFEFEQPKPEAFEDEYEIPDEIETDIVIGDLFEIGPHRLLCGDSTKMEDVERLMNGGRAEMVWTDPPYGVAIGDKNKWLNTVGPSNRIERNLKNDNLGEVVLMKMLISSIKNAVLSCLPGASWYVAAPAGPPHLLFGQALKDQGIWRQTIQWVKNNSTFSPMGVSYHWQSEPIFYGWLPNAAKRFHGDRKQTTVWNIDRPVKSTEHPTMKPISLVARAIEHASLQAEIVLDIFLGSGTTMVAAHQLNRVCYGMELDEKYCQVIVDRMLKLDPTLEVKKNGQPYQKPVLNP
jgi:DNA modification methylase